ncbi:MAG: hypothetical protein ABUS54_14185 [Actinomycetota bacterium]
MRLVALVLVLLSLSAVAAQADGDPASDWLYTQKVFVPFDVKATKANQRELTMTVEGAWKQQFRIKVAVIGNAYDLGAVPSLWRKPQTYARFLGAELVFLYKQRLLIVMPNGFGFYWHGHSTTAPYATLDRIAIPAGPDGLVTAAREAVVQLAAKSGVEITAAKAPADHTNRDRMIIIVAAVALIALALLGRFALRRRG